VYFDFHNIPQQMQQIKTLNSIKKIKKQQKRTKEKNFVFFCAYIGKISVASVAARKTDSTTLFKVHPWGNRRRRRRGVYYPKYPRKIKKALLPISKISRKNKKALFNQKIAHMIYYADE
jgi:hypothetical protein